MSAIALVAFAFTLTCGGAVPLHFVVDPSFDGRERQELAAAAAAWNDVAREEIELGGGPWRIERGPLDPQLGGETFPDERRIVMRAGLDADLFAQIALHELGHAHGLRHVRGYGVMFWNADDRQAQVVTDVDVAECRRVAACE